MQTQKLIHTVSCHAEGEVGDVIVGGVAPPPGDTLWDQSRWIARDQSLRNFMLNEPRGGVFRHVNLLVPPKNPAAQMGFIIMEPEDTPPMSGSNSMCVATVLLETGILPMQEPETCLTLEAPGGLIQAVAACCNGKVEQVTIHNVPSFVDRLGAILEVPGMGSFKVDTAYGGDSFVVVEAKDLGFAVSPDEARDLAETGIKLTKAANEQLGFHHPGNPEWKHISFCQITAPLAEENKVLVGRNAVVIQPGKLDRSPTGTGCSARLGPAEKKGSDRNRRQLYRRVHNRLPVSLPAGIPDPGGGSGGGDSEHNWSGMGDRDPPAHAGCGRSLAGRVSDCGYLAHHSLNFA